jgi:hypothetical protein
MLKVLLVAGLIASAPALAGTAEAAVVDVVITGFVRDNAIDTGDYWNRALAAGAAFTAKYTYDTSLGRLEDMISGSPGEFLSGGTNDPGGLPISAALTVGSETRAIGGGPSFPVNHLTGSAIISLNEGPGGPYPTAWASYDVQVQAYDLTATRSLFGRLHFDLSVPRGTLPGDLTTGYALTFDPDVYTQGGDLGLWGAADFSEYDAVSGLYVFRSLAFLYGTRIEVIPRSPVAPVPLAAAFPGFALALAGLALLRRPSRDRGPN